MSDEDFKYVLPEDKPLWRRLRHAWRNWIHKRNLRRDVARMKKQRAEHAQKKKE